MLRRRVAVVMAIPTAVKVTCVSNMLLPVGCFIGQGEGPNIVVKIVKRDPATQGFEVLRRRSVVERTFVWIVTSLTHDYEQTHRCGRALINIAATATLIRRWP